MAIRMLSIRTAFVYGSEALSSKRGHFKPTLTIKGLSDLILVGPKYLSLDQNMNMAEYFWLVHTKNYIPFFCKIRIFGSMFINS